MKNLNFSSSCSDEGDSIKVYVRVRPPAKTFEQDIDHSLCVEATSSKSLILHSKPEPKQFSYDHVADMNTTQVSFCFFNFMFIFHLRGFYAIPE